MTGVVDFASDIVEMTRAVAPLRFFLFCALLFAGLMVGGVQRAKAAAAKPAPRVLNNYRTDRAFDGMAFDEPVQVLFAPGEKNRAFVLERSGAIVVLRDLAKPDREVFLDLSKLGRSFDRSHGALSMAFHPRFAENGFFYVWYSTNDKGPRANRLARFKVKDGAPQVGDIASHLPLITQPTGPTGHDGAHLLFGPDGYLYVSVGDGDEHYPEPAASHQRIDLGFFGAVLRLDVDKKPGSLPPNPHPAVHPGTYTIPPDNPFVGATNFNGAKVDPARVRTEFWCVGLRNPWRIAFDPATGLLWCGDVGLKAREEVNILVRGGNYGWNFREGTIAGQRSSAPREARFIDPVWEYEPNQGMSVTGGFVYHGTAYPELEGKYLFADYGFGRLWALEPDGEKRVGPERVTQIAAVPSIVAFTHDPRNDEILLTSFGEGEILRLVKKPEARK